MGPVQNLTRLVIVNEHTVQYCVIKTKKFALNEDK